MILKRPKINRVARVLLIFLVLKISAFGQTDLIILNADIRTKRLSVEEAVRAYTLGAAFAEFQETEKGTVTAGKLADFLILSDDIFTLAPSRIRGTKVLTTVMNGKIVYRAE